MTGYVRLESGDTFPVIELGDGPWGLFAQTSVSWRFAFLTLGGTWQAWGPHFSADEITALTPYESFVIPSEYGSEKDNRVSGSAIAVARYIVCGRLTVQDDAREDTIGKVFREDESIRIVCKMRPAREVGYYWSAPASSTLRRWADSALKGTGRKRSGRMAMRATSSGWTFTVDTAPVS